MSKVKMFAMIPRKHGVSLQEFHDHWRHPHGTIGRRISTIRKYVQSHRVPCGHLGPEQEAYDGIAEVWMDSPSDALALGTEPTYVSHAVPDEPLFIDMEKLCFFITEEDVIDSGPDHRTSLNYADSLWFDDDRAFSVKIIQLLYEAHATHAEEDHRSGRALGAFRQVRCTPAAGAYAEAAPPLRGVRELWWPTITHFEAGVAAAPDVWQVLASTPAAATFLVQAERFK